MKDRYLQMIRDAGFKEVKVVEENVSQSRIWLTIQLHKKLSKLQEYPLRR